MRIILKIAKAELRTLYYSPIAWVVLITFLVISGMQFVEPLLRASRIQDVEITNSPNWPGFLNTPLTNDLLGPAIAAMKSYLYLFIPLLTMGVISREVNAGSMALLSSSPVTVKEIVLGKYLGLILLNLALMTVIAIVLLTGYFSIEHAELPLLVSMWAGFLLLSNTYMAIGLFISCITNFQIAAGIGTFVVLYILNVIGGFLQHYDLVRDITWFLSLNGRADPFMNGLITTRDIIYFALIIFLFLRLSIIQLKARYEPVKKTVSFYRYASVITVVLLLGYFSGRPGYVGYLDVTRNQRNTIDSATQAVLKELDGSELTVTLYTNLLSSTYRFGLPFERNKYVWGFWEKYVRFYPQITLKYEYYYNRSQEDSVAYSIFYGKKTKREIAEKNAGVYRMSINRFRTPAEMDSIIDLSDENYKLVMGLDYKGKKTFLRTFKGSNFWPGEPNVSGAISTLTRPDLPKVLFSTGHLERSPFRNAEREYGNHTNNKNEIKALINLGVQVDTIALQNQDIPASTDVLVMADPKTDLTKPEQEKILQYLQSGGNAVFYAEPGKQHISNPLLHTLGVTMEPGILVLPRKHIETHAFSGIMTKAGNDMSKEPRMQIFQKLGWGNAVANFMGTGILSYIEKEGFTIEPIVTVTGNNNIWLERGLFVADSAAPVFAPSEGDIKKETYVLALKLTRTVNNKEQRIVIAADADFMSAENKSGGTIGLGLYSWLLNNQYPVYTKVKIPEDIRLTINGKTANMQRIALVWLFPSILLLAGTVLLIRRKRQ